MSYAFVTLRKRMFDEGKSTQAAALLLEKSGGTMNYMVLIKMLYVADRTSLLKRGRPITGDEFVSMKFGPVLSRVHDLITEMAAPGEPLIWKRYISEPSNYKVDLLSSPGSDELSDNEVTILNHTFEEFQRFLNRPFDFADFLHQHFPEVIPVERGQQFPLSVNDILAKNDIPEDQKNAILDELCSLQECYPIMRH